MDAIIESCFDGLYITDGLSNTLKVNKSYERITGIKREAVIGKNMHELLESGIISESVTLKVLETKQIATIEQAFSSGKKALVSGTPIFDDKGNISLVVTNVRDITQLSNLSHQVINDGESGKSKVPYLKLMTEEIRKNTNIVADDERFMNVLISAKKVSMLDTTVLVLGETGAGKEEVVKFIHQNSRRSNKQFVKINCGTIPPNLIESELFGYEKGAFTGANESGKKGLFEIASGGTIFLDEIGEIPLHVQVKLLRVLQEQEIERVGGVKSIKIDVRVLTATNRDLKKMIAQNKFREDLYYRINVVPIMLPPLRECKGNILPLIYQFLNRINGKYGFNKYFSPGVLDYLYEYDWPGNVRELKNIVERMIILSKGDRIEVIDIPKEIIQYRNQNEIILKSQAELPLREAVHKLEIEMINNAYNKYGNVRSAAESLGIDAATLVRKRKKYQQFS